MTEAIIALITLFLVILSLIGLFVWYVKESNDQREMLLRALMAEDLREYDSGKIEPAPIQEEKPVDEVPIEDLDNEQFEKFIKGQNLAEKEE